jgi:hypothetical protein
VATVNITQAAKLAGLSRSYFQKKYIKTGLISSETGKDGHKKIDTSEILRVFGKLENTPEHSDMGVFSRHHDTPKDIPENTPHIEQQIRLAELEVENRMLKERMDEMKEQYSTQLRLLEHMVENHKPWWKFWK